MFKSKACLASCALAVWTAECHTYVQLNWLLLLFQDEIAWLEEHRSPISNSMDLFSN